MSLEMSRENDMDNFESSSDLEKCASIPPFSPVSSKNPILKKKPSNPSKWFSNLSLHWKRESSTKKENGQGRMDQTEVRKLEDHPRGYPSVACFLDSDDAFMIYRRFGYVFARLLLSKQEEIARMERLLATMDKIDDKKEETRVFLRSCFEDGRREGDLPVGWPEGGRVGLMERLEGRVREYADLLLKAQQLKALEKPSGRDYRSVLHFMENDGGPLPRLESEFIYDKEDLVTLRPGRDHAWLDGILECLLRKLRCRFIIYLFCSEDVRKKTDDPDIHYYSRERIALCITLIITVMVLALLVVPVWILYKISIDGQIATSPDSLCVVAVCTLIVTGLLAAFTKARRHEIVAASAAYCAVLVVFLGNLPT